MLFRLKITIPHCTKADAKPAQVVLLRTAWDKDHRAIVISGEEGAQRERLKYEQRTNGVPERPGSIRKASSERTLPVGRPYENGPTTESFRFGRSLLIKSS
jgi:hypothetical protein